VVIKFRKELFESGNTEITKELWQIRKQITDTHTEEFMGKMPIEKKQK